MTRLFRGSRLLGGLALAAVCLVGAGCEPGPGAGSGAMDTAGGAAERPHSDNPAIDRAIGAVYPALVRIHVVTVDYEAGREQRFEAGGSGAIISAEGYVVTNHHVAGKARWIRCILADREELDATLVGTDPLGDISVLKLDLSQRSKSAGPLPFARFGNSQALKVGDTVLAMGSPLTISQSVTEGIVSNTNMTIPTFFWPFTFTLDGESVGELVRWIGHDAAIYGGNSGGPLVNLRGEIVGINEISLGLAGAIPGNLAKAVADEIIAKGKVTRSWTGLELQPMLHDGAGDEPTTGALVSGVVADSPAAKAGVQPGDVLTAFNGTPVAVRFAEELPTVNRLVLETPVGATVKLTLSRAGQALEKSLVTATREAARGEEAELPAWGITARSFTRMSALEAQHAENGVYIYSLRDGGPATEAKPALQGGDVITAVNGQAVKDLAALQKLTQAALGESEKPVTVLVAFDRKTEQLMTSVDLNRKDSLDRSAEVKKAWLPVRFQVLTKPLVKSLGLEEELTGVRVTQMLPGFAQATGGLQVGDLILAMDGVRIEASQPEDLDVFPAMVRQYKINSTAELKILRDKQEKKVTVTLVDRPVDARELKTFENKQYDFKARDLSMMDRVARQWPLDQTGALVTAVEPGGWAAVAHLAVGDLILRIGDLSVASVDDLTAGLKAIDTAQPKYAVFFVRRGIHTFYLEVVTQYTDEK